MRKLGKQISQRGHGKNVKKTPGAIIAELTVKIKKEKAKKTDKKFTKATKKKTQVTKAEIAKKLNISERTLRSYKKYFASLENKDIKLSKYDRKPKNEKAFSKKFSEVTSEINKTLPKKQRVKKTRIQGNKYDVGAVDNIDFLISPSTYKRLKKQLAKESVYGFLIRVNVLFITKDGSYDEWLTFVPPVKTSPKLKNYKELNTFLKQEIESNFKSKSNIYSYRHSVLGFEILEVIAVPTLNLPDKK